MKTLKRSCVLAVALSALLCAGCNTESKEETEKRQREKGELRHSLFVECMGLAFKNPRYGDDDVSDIVSECGTQSYYMAAQITGT